MMNGVDTGPIGGVREAALIGRYQDTLSAKKAVVKLLNMIALGKGDTFVSEYVLYMQPWIKLEKQREFNQAVEKAPQIESKMTNLLKKYSGNKGKLREGFYGRKD